MGLFQNIGAAVRRTNEQLNPYIQIAKLQSILNIFQRADTRPQQLNNAYNNVIYPIYPWPMRTIADLAKASDTLLAIHKALRREMFRNGIEIIEADKTDADVTDAHEHEAADPKVRGQILKQVSKINLNGQSLKQVLEEYEDMINIFDDGFLHIRYDYQVAQNGAVVKKTFKEAIVLDSAIMGLVMNDRDEFAQDNEGKKLTVCPAHRDVLLVGKERCPACGCETYAAWYEAKPTGGKPTYYFEDEVVHMSRYRPSKRLGYSPVITLWMKIRTLIMQDEYILQLYEGKRPPKGLLAFTTANSEGLKKSWNEMIQQAKESPHMPAVIGVPPSISKSGKPFEYVDFMRSLEELQFTTQREEFRATMGAVYGISQIFQNDTSSSGGLNNEGHQITVTNRSIEDGQTQYNEVLLSRLIEAMGYSGWSLRLRPNEEQDDNVRLERQNKALMNAEVATRLGLKVEWDEKAGDITIQSGQVPGSMNQGQQASSELFSPNDNAGAVPDANTGSPVDTLPKDNESGTANSIKTIDEWKAAKNPNVSKLWTANTIAKAKARPAFSQLQQRLQDEIAKFLKLYKRKPTEMELKARVAKIERDMAREMHFASQQYFNTIYKNELLAMEKHLDMNFAMEKTDHEALHVLANQPVLTEAFAGLSTKVAKKLNEVIDQAYKTEGGLNLKQIQKQIQDVANVADYHAENIARTETAKVSAAARYNSYQKADPLGEFVYKWIGPSASDKRTTECSKRIMERTAEGVTWNELVKIVKEESAKYFPTWKVDEQWPVSHWNSRHTFTRVQ